MDNSGNQELWVNKTIGKDVVRMLEMLRDKIKTAARETRLRAVY